MLIVILFQTSSIELIVWLAEKGDTQKDYVKTELLSKWLTINSIINYGSTKTSGWTSKEKWQS